MIFPGCAAYSRVSPAPRNNDVTNACSLAASQTSRRHDRGRRSVPLVLLALKRPPAFVHEPVMRSTHEREVGQRGRAAARPPDQVMPVAPDWWPRATGEDAVAVARLERAPRRRRQAPAGAIELVIELVLTGDATERAVARVALDGFGGHRAAALELARRRALGPGQRLERGADDELRPGAGTIPLAA